MVQGSDAGLRPIPRNWSKRGGRFRRADRFVVSIPKSGRTWLRVFLQHYLCSGAGVEFALKLRADAPPEIPRVEFTHDLWEHTTAPRLYDRLRGKYLIPGPVRRRARVVLAVRDLRDVMVSLHTHFAKRRFHSGASFEGDLGALVRDSRFGAERSVAIVNRWLAESRKKPRETRFSSWN